MNNKLVVNLRQAIPDTSEVFVSQLLPGTVFTDNCNTWLLLAPDADRQTTVPVVSLVDFKLRYQGPYYRIKVSQVVKNPTLSGDLP